MTPEELDRAIEFVVRQQAQFSVTLERDHEALNKGIVELQASGKRLERLQIELARNHQRIAEIIDIQAQRMDEGSQRMDQHAERMDQDARRMDENEKWQRQFQRETRERHEELMKRLDRILDRLTGSNPNPN